MNSEHNIRVITADASKNEAALGRGLSVILLVGILIVLVVSIGNMSGI